MEVSPAGCEGALNPAEIFLKNLLKNSRKKPWKVSVNEDHW